MTKIRKLLGVSAILGLLLSTQPVVAAANRCCDPCGEWSVGAQALYFSPIACPYDYAESFIQTVIGPLTNVNAQAHSVPCRADWGFRVFANYVGDCAFAGVSYQRFDVSTTRKVDSADPLILRGGTIASPGAATGQTAFDYQNIDVRLGKYLLRGCSVAFYLYGNARWVDLFYKRALRYASSAAPQFFEKRQETSQLEGGALGIGAGGEFDVWCGIGAFVDGNILGVIGRRSLKDVKFQQSFGATDNQLFYPSDTCVIPEIDFRIGINYSYECGCWKLVGELGYELDYFYRASEFPEFVTSATFSTGRFFAPRCEDLGFSGLFFGGRVIF